MQENELITSLSIILQNPVLLVYLIRDSPRDIIHDGSIAPAGKLNCHVLLLTQTPNLEIMVIPVPKRTGLNMPIDLPSTATSISAFLCIAKCS